MEHYELPDNLSRRMIDYLLCQLIDKDIQFLSDKEKVDNFLDEQHSHPGIGEPSPLSKLNGEPTKAEELIIKLQAQIEKQQKWLNKRLDEVATMHKALEDCNERRRSHASAKIKLSKSIRRFLDQLQDSDFVITAPKYFTSDWKELENAYKQVGYGSFDYTPMSYVSTP